MIGLIDCLKAAGTAVNLGNLKIHLACWNGREHPIDVYYAGRFKEWQDWQTRRNFIAGFANAALPKSVRCHFPPDFWIYPALTNGIELK